MCKFLLDGSAGGNASPELLYFVTNAWKAIESCGTLPVAAIAKVNLIAFLRNVGV